MHIHGRQNFCLARARKLVAEHYVPAFADIIELEGGHHLQSKLDYCREAMNRIMKQLIRHLPTAPRAQNKGGSRVEERLKHVPIRSRIYH